MGGTKPNYFQLFLYQFWPQTMLKRSTRQNRFCPYCDFWYTENLLYLLFECWLDLILVLFHLYFSSVYSLTLLVCWSIWLFRPGFSTCNFPLLTLLHFLNACLLFDLFVSSPCQLFSEFHVLVTHCQNCLNKLNEI